MTCCCKKSLQSYLYCKINFAVQAISVYFSIVVINIILAVILTINLLKIINGLVHLAIINFGDIKMRTF